MPLKNVYITSLELDQKIIREGEQFFAKNKEQLDDLVDKFSKKISFLPVENPVTMEEAQKTAGRIIPPGAKLPDKHNFSWIECYVDKVETDALEIINKFTPEGKPMTDKQFKELFETIESDYQDYKFAVGLKFTIVLVGKEKIRRLFFLVLLARNLILTIHCTEKNPTKLFAGSDELLQKTFEDVFKRSSEVVNDARTLILARVIDDVAGINFAALRAITKKADNLEKDLKGKGEVEMYKELTKIRKYLLRFHEAMWSIYDAVYQLRHGDAKVISDQRNILNEFNNLQTRITNQIHMSENVIQLVATGFNVIQARSTSEVSIHIILLTVLGTIVLVPNTVATVFGPIHLKGIGEGTLMTLLTVGTFGAALLFYAKRWWSLRKMRSGDYFKEDLEEDL